MTAVAHPPTPVADVDAQPAVDDERRHARSVWRMRLAVWSLALTLLAFVQQPDRIATDTKLDLVVSPIAFLERTLHIWNPQAAFGQLQNQANGYLFPMGPFFAAGEAVGAPAWVVQRAWWALILVVAFLGVIKLTGVLRIGTPATRVAAALAYALAPRILATMGSVSIETWPSAMAPWVLVPAVLAYRGGSIRRCAATSALAVVAIGGVNATATAVAVLPTALFILSAPRWNGRWRFAAPWFLAVVAVTVWWTVPLFLLGGYSPPFLDWIETAATTTAHTTVFESFRGVNHWLTYFVRDWTPLWPGAWLLVNVPVIIVDTALVAGIGLAGLAIRSLPLRTFLLSTTVLGLFLLTMGHVSPDVSSPFAEQIRHALDRALAPLRNVHKFDLLVRLPLALGMAHLLARVRIPPWSRRHARIGATAVAGVAIIGMAIPGLTREVPPQGAFEELPDHWAETAAWLDEHATRGRALVVPGASSGVYEWGTSRDEPLQALTEAPWAVRDGVPLSSAGNIRLLDAIEGRLAEGRGGAGVAAALERAGVTHLVVRNDLDRSVTRSTRPLLVHQAVAQLPGVRWVASFGSATGTHETPTTTTDARLDPPYSAVDVFTVGDPDVDGRVRTYPAAGSVRMSGGPESIVPAGDAGLLDGRAVFIGDDGAHIYDRAPVPLVTDGLRRRSVWFGSTDSNTTEVLRADDDGPFDRVARDYLEEDDPERQTVAVVSGAKDVEASSTASNPRSIPVRGPQYSPWSAVDGDVETAWLSSAPGWAVGQWLTVTLNSPVDIDGVDLTMMDASTVTARATEVTLTTDSGVRTSAIDPTGETQWVPVVPGPTSKVTVTITAVEPGRTGSAGIRELTIPGVAVNRSLRTAPLQTADVGATSHTETVSLSVAPGSRSDCARYGSSWRCGPDLARQGEEDTSLNRLVTLNSGGEYNVSAQVLPRPGEALDELIPVPEGGIRAAASSRMIAGPVGRPQATVDRDPATGWVAAPDDERPTLTLTWEERRTIRGLRFETSTGLAGSRPTRVGIEIAGRTEVHDVDDDGTVRLDRPTRGDGLTITFHGVDPLESRDPDFGVATSLPVGVSEVAVLGADSFRMAIDPTTRTGLFCGSGPELSIDGRIHPTEVVGTVAEILEDRPLELRICGEEAVTLSRGERPVVLSDGPATRPYSVVLTPAAPPRPPSDSMSAEVVTWEPTHREIAVGGRGEPMVVVVPENDNAGWQATLDGEVLEHARVDGWAQGYVVPTGEKGVITLTYRPDGTYRAALGAGLAAVLLVIVVALIPGRRRGSQSQANGRGRNRPRRTADRHGSRAALGGVLAGVIGLWLLGGSAGLWAAAAAATLGVALHWRPAIASRLPILVVSGVLVAAVLAARRPWPDYEPGSHAPETQVAVLVAVAIAILPIAVARLLGRVSRVSRGGGVSSAPPDAQSSDS